MAAFNNVRRGANTAFQFLREVNERPAAADEAQYALDETDISLYTNTEFYDIETGQNTDFQPQPAKPDPDSHGDRTGDSPAVMDDFANMDFMPGEFFSDFGSTYPSPTMPAFPDGLGSLHQPIQPGLSSVYPPVPQSQPQPQSHSYAPPPPRLAGKRSMPGAMSPETPASFEEHTRHAAEEDKRRRNTAASARFRVKKKQREQALEKTSKEMAERVTALEGRILQLETENKWLKNIVVEKNGGNDDFLAKLLEEYNAKNQSRLQKEADEVASQRRPTSPEEREAADSSG